MVLAGRSTLGGERVGEALHAARLRLAAAGHAARRSPRSTRRPPGTRRRRAGAGRRARLRRSRTPAGSEAARARSRSIARHGLDPVAGDATATVFVRSRICSRPDSTYGASSPSIAATATAGSKARRVTQHEPGLQPDAPIERRAPRSGLGSPGAARSSSPCRRSVSIRSCSSSAETPCDGELAAEPVGLLEAGRPAAAAGGGERGGNAARASPDDEDLALDLAQRRCPGLREHA